MQQDELNDFWKKALKIPDEKQNKIDVNSFTSIVSDIDDLFVEDVDIDVVGGSSTDEEDEIALRDNFLKICDDDKLLSKGGLMAWDEISRLLDDGLLGDDEFESLWSQTPSKTTAGLIDVDGFMAFNALLDDLFVFDDIDDDSLLNDEVTTVDTDDIDPSKPRSQVSGEDLPPGVLFSALANTDYLVGSDELQLWTELQDMLKEGDLLPQELQDLFAANAVKQEGKDKNYMTEETFVNFYEALDALFEEEEEAASSSDAKLALLEFLDDLNDDTSRLTCGLEAEERDEKIVQNIVLALEGDGVANVIRKKKGEIGPDDLIGDWRLLYSSSAAMKFNKGLSGIGGSMPNGKFAGLTQSLSFARFRQDIVYMEQIDCTPASASFEVEVNGAWELRKSISLFTNQPCTMLLVQPNAVKYGPTSTRGDHWKSLGPMNLLDVTYLDDDLRIMRGNTASDAIFVWQRIL